jgi:capsular polysaccharide export protein
LEGSGTPDASTGSLTPDGARAAIRAMPDRLPADDGTPQLLDPLATVDTACVVTRGVAQIPTLPGLLEGVRLVRPREAAAAGARVALAWGRKPSAERAERWASEHRLPVWRLEDGFLRSVGLGAVDPPLSVVVDDRGIYYDADAPSRLEALVSRPLDEAERRRAEDVAARWRAVQASKYNHARDASSELAAEAAGSVMVVDQTANDASIRFGHADPSSFDRMLEAALDEHPAARVLLKVHPDVVAGRKSGHFDRLSRGAAARVTVLATDVHPPSLLSTAAAVYTVTSQVGFEALLWGRPVRCFGMPFYGGWGLTADALPAPERRGGASLASLVHAALLDYPRYVDPETRERCSIERILDWIALQRRQRARFAARVVAFGFSRWKKPIVRSFFGGSQVRFASPGSKVAAGAPVALWGRRALPRRVALDTPVIRLEDGFLRSVGLGADLVRPLSWVMDTQGMYYDARTASGLERLLQGRDFGEAELARAARLRERVLALGLTKYNVGSGRWQRPAGRPFVVLAVGQVEDDAAVLYGARGIRTNMALLRAVRAERPDAWLVYKPHPDVVARLRKRGAGESEARRLCDEVVVDVTMDAMLRDVDEVHVLTSLAGFEALLRGKPVVTWGVPFYAGWGLTSDRETIERRTRRRSLDELVAATLVEYPAYISRVSGHFTTPERVLQELHDWREAGGGDRPSWAKRALRRVLGWTQRWRRRNND